MQKTFLRLLVICFIQTGLRADICVLPPFSFTFDANKNCNDFNQAVQSLNGVLAKQCSFAEPSPPTLDAITLQAFDSANVAQTFQPTSNTNGVYVFENVPATNFVKVRLSMQATNVFGPINVDGIVQFDGTTCSGSDAERNPFGPSMVWPWGTMTFRDDSNPSQPSSPTQGATGAPTRTPTRAPTRPPKPPSRPSPPVIAKPASAPTETCFSKGIRCTKRSQCCSGLSCRSSTRANSLKRCRACVEQGGPCTSNGDCCPRSGLRCHSVLLQCQPCGGEGTSCLRKRDCCSNLTCNLSTEQCVAK